MLRLRRPAPVDSELLTLLQQSGANVQRVARLVRDLLEDYPEHALLADDVRACEHDGDRITREIIRRLNGNSSRLPFSASDGHALATSLDDIVDHAEQTAAALGVYGVEAPMQQAVTLAEVLVQASRHVARVLDALADGTELGPSLGEIHRLESEGDRVLRDGLASLFANGIDPMVVIRWKDIFGSLESSVDACQTVANVIEGISLKRGRR